MAAPSGGSHAADLRPWRRHTSVRERRDRRIKCRDGLFRRYLLSGLVEDSAAAEIINADWGRYGAQFRWKRASLSSTDVEHLGEGPFEDEELTAALAPGSHGRAERPDTVLLRLARQSMAASIDLL